MKTYFKTKHEKNSAKLTTLIAVILLLLLFVVGTPYMDPPEEYGVAVNFGNTNFGKGKVQPLKPVKSEPRKIEQPHQPDVSKAEPTKTKASETKEEVLTQDNDESIAIKKQKEAETKAKAVADAKAKADAIAEAKAKAEAERIAKAKREQEEKKRKLDALIGGVSKSEGSETGSEGNDNRAGDKGQLDGNPYAPSYFGGRGTGSGGVGYGLNGRGTASYKKLKQDCNESGLVIVKIIVNQSGNVIQAVPGVKGTTNTAPCLLEPAKKIALSHKWRSDSKAPAKQIGFVKVNFKLGQ
ncbi:energy transducer TonB [Flavivirga abyssicola]|uniref:energy transducer TonB n=1 Tax=Flavivirga abyssicola TaxID=3063533 RepID=UPI0026E0656A|nr:energy transducer TonB [Flavivirga sp. MEBiC07777]WVK11767.1 energy transducer TonB [Flavivirga sp. MEBiC07777]